MPLLFLVIYIVISYLIFKKNKQNIKQIPIIIKLTGVIAFALLFIFIMYYSKQNISSESNLLKSFYGLIFGYLTVFIVYLFKYRNIIKKENIELYTDKSVIDKSINNIYLINIIIFSALYFKYSEVYYNYGIGFGNWFKLLLYIFFILSGIYILFEQKILGIKKILKK